MNESDRLWLKYEDQGLLDRLDSLDDVNRLALTFCEDVARTYRAPWKGAVSQRVRIPPGNCRSSRKQSERCREVTKCTEALR